MRYDTNGRNSDVSCILADAQAARFEIQHFRPLADSIEWELGLRYYDRGSQAFAGDRPVPFAINNDGNLSRDAAHILFDALRTADQNGILESEIFVLELGPGVGLFARYFLDAFCDLCRERNMDYYDRLTYVVGDRSERMLADICRRGVFARHLGRYLLRIVDALCPSDMLVNDSLFADGKPFRGVFLNYLLDSLPCAVLKTDEGAITQLCVRTCLARGVKLSDYTDLSADDLAYRAISTDPASRRILAEFFDLFASE